MKVVRILSWSFRYLKRRKLICLAIISVVLYLFLRVRVLDSHKNDWQAAHVLDSHKNDWQAARVLDSHKNNWQAAHVLDSHKNDWQTEFHEASIMPTQSNLSENLSKNIKIHYELIRNLESSRHFGTINITNTGRTPIHLQNLTLYFCGVRILKMPFNKQMKLSHINGCLYKLEPASNSVQISPGQTISLEHEGRYFVGCRTHLMPNWYFVGPNDEVSVVSNTMGEQLSFVGEFKRPAQWIMDPPEDSIDPYTPEKRYDVIGFDAPEGEDTLLVIPQPMHIVNLDTAKKMTIDNNWRVYAEKGLEKEARILKAMFQIQKESLSTDKQPRDIILKTGDPGVMVGKSSSPSSEAYALMVNTADQYVEVIGKTATGVFYAVQTLLSLADEKGTVPMVTIRDAPRFEYRGMHLDISRNFHSKAAVFRLLEVMSMYKMNTFHFHLSDDEAWRIEIPGLPELTTIGSKRCHDPTGLKCLQPQLGSDPRGQTTPTYYTIKDYQEILEYANDRHIQVIPEIDMPGHCHAAIKSMEARNRILKKKGYNAEAEEFLLTEFNDKTDYLSVQSFKDNTLNPCLDSTYRFISHVIKALVGMHKDIQPLTTYHFGGDEVPRGVWRDSPSCEKLIPAVDYEEKRKKIKEHFVKRVFDITASLDLNVAGWDDFLFSVKKKPNQEILAFSWNDIKRSRGAEKAYLLAQQGYKIVLAHASHLYFDHPYEPDPEERGNYWATRFTDTRKVFGYAPNFCKTAGICKASEGVSNIFGMTGALWSETVRTADQLVYMIFPRLLALAERAWHKAPWEDTQDNEEMEKQKIEEWEKFSSFLVNHELRRLEKMGIKYRLPLPGARFDGNRIKVRTALPGLPVQFSKDGGKTWHDVTKDTQIDSKVTLVTRSIDRLRMSRSIEVQPP